MKKDEKNSSKNAVWNDYLMFAQQFKSNSYETLYFFKM